MKKGDKIYIKICRNSSIIIEAKIKTIGKKYITVEYDDSIKYCANTLLQVNEYGAKLSVNVVQAMCPTVCTGMM